MLSAFEQKKIEAKLVTQDHIFIQKRRDSLSLQQHSLADFCIVSADLFSTVSDVRVQRRAELPTDYHLVVCTLKAVKPLRK